MNKIKLIEKNHQHFYETVDGTFPSATTILAILNKPALVPWAVNTTISYLGDRLDDIKSGKLELTCQNASSILGIAKRQHHNIATKAAEIGTNVHALIENHVKDMPFDEYIVEKELNPMHRAYCAYLDWEHEHAFELIGSEVRIYSTFQGGYGGTLDMAAKIDGKPYIIDLKTSSRIYDDYIMQIAAYRYAYAQLFDIAIEGMGILRLDKVTGKFEWREYTQKQYQHALKMFGHLCKFWHLKND